MVSLIFCYQQTYICYSVLAPKYTYPDKYLFITLQERLSVGWMLKKMLVSWREPLLGEIQVMSNHMYNPANNNRNVN